MPDLDPTGHQHSSSNQVEWVLSAIGPWPARRDPGGPEALQQVTVDSVPSGTVDIRRELTVCATDGEIGQVQGLVVEPGGHQVTRVLLQKGHLRGRKEAAIPISAVTKIGTFLITQQVDLYGDTPYPGPTVATKLTTAAAGSFRTVGPAFESRSEREERSRRTWRPGRTN